MRWMIFEHNEDSEKRHLVDSLNLLIFICLLIMTVLTIWLFKSVRFRFLHETGLSIIYGLIVGAIIKFTAPQHLPAIVVDDFNKINTVTPTTFTPNGFHNNSLAFTTMVPLTNISTTKAPPVKTKLPQEVIQLPAEEPELEEKAQFNPEVFFNVLLPPIIFHAGYSMKKKQFFQNIGSIAFYAFIGTLISTFTTAVVMFTFLYIIKYSWDFIDCLKFGAIISATDPVSVLAIFNDLGVDAELYALVFGESVLNDAVAIVLVSTVNTYKSEVLGFDGVAFVTSVAHFFVVFFGAFALGCAMGCITALITKFTHLRDHPLLETTLFVLMSYATFLAAEAAQMTGIVALLFCGVCQAHYTYNNMSPESRSRTKQLFELLNFLTENFVFLYIGVATFTFHKHVWNVPFICFAFLAIIVARVCNIYPLSAILNLGRSNPIPASFQHFMVFSGLRGAMAFALSIRETSSTKDCTIFSTTLLIVMTTIVLSGGLTTQSLGWLNIKMALPATEGETRTFDSLHNSPRRYVLNDLHLNQHPTGPFLFRLWHKFDHKFLKPLLTHARPPLTDTLPTCCLPFAKVFTSEQQKQQVIIGDDSDLSLSSRNVDGNLNDEFFHSTSVFQNLDKENENAINNNNNNINNENNINNNSTPDNNDDINTNNNNNNNIEDAYPSQSSVCRF